MFKKELFDQIKNISVDEIQASYYDLHKTFGEEISLDRFTTLVKAAKNSVNFEEWASILSGIESNVGPIKMSMQELEALRGGAKSAGSNFGWNQIYSRNLKEAPSANMKADRERQIDLDQQQNLRKAKGQRDY